MSPQGKPSWGADTGADVFLGHTITVVTASSPCFSIQHGPSEDTGNPSPALRIRLKLQKAEGGEADNRVRPPDAIKTPIRQIGTILGQDVARFASASWRRFP